MTYGIYYSFSLLLLIFLGLSFLPGKIANAVKVVVFILSLIAINEGVYYVLGQPKPLEYLTVQNTNIEGIVVGGYISKDNKNIFILLQQDDGDPILITIPNTDKNEMAKKFKIAKQKMLQRFGKENGFRFQGEGTEGGSGGFFIPNTLPQDEEFKKQ